MLRLRLISLLLGLAVAGGAAAPEPTQPLPARGQYRDLFRELLGQTDAEVDARLAAAWQQLFHGDDANQRVYYPVGGDQAYIADIGNGDVRSEGMSYGLMIAVQMNRREEFDRLWKWARTHMYHAAGPRRGYFAWHCKFDGTPLDPGSASDGEEWFAMALLFAAHRWGNGEGIFDYGAEAQALLREMLHKTATAEVTSIFDRAQKQVVFAPTPRASQFTDPSYHLPAFYELWSRWAADEKDRAFWSEVAATSRGFFKKAAHPRTGLMPEYANFDGTPRRGDGREDFRFDAWRTLANVALDHAWFAADPWAREQSDRVLRFLLAQGPQMANQFTLEGRPLSSDSSPGLIAMAAVAGLAADPKLARPFVERLWAAPIPSGKWRYYDGLLYLLGLLQVSGRFQIHAPSVPVAFERFEYTGRDSVFAPPLAPGHYRNPILAGFYPDPSICRVGDDYYLINSTFAYFPGLPIFHSRDLVHWTQLGHAVSQPTQLNYDGLGVSRGLFAPAISHHRGIFYVVCTMIDAGGNFLLTATNPAGPWSDPVWLGFDGIDPSLFFDDDGRAYLVNNGPPPDNRPLYDGHRAIWIQECDPTANRLVGPRAIIVNGGVDLAKKPVWIEGPHLYRRGGWYYLSCAEGGTGDNHSQVIFRSKSVTGPYVPWDRNPILTQRNLDGTQPQAVTSTGHADLVIGPDGNWWAVFLGCRPYAGRYYHTGRETFLLPVKWTDDGWPLILPPGERVPYVLPAPKVERVDSVTAGKPNAFSSAPSKESALRSTRSTSADQPPLTGNFTWRDEFDSPALSPLWIMLRQPHETWWRLTANPGHLSLTPRRETLSGKGNPSFLARRLQHARFEATTALTAPTTAGVSAGLAAFQNETHHYFFGVRRAAAGLEVFVERFNGKRPEIVATATIPEAARIELRLTGGEKVLAFAYATDAGQWQTLVPDADATVLSTQTAGGFVGAVVGLHARIER